MKETKTLVAYFSASGVTERVARRIAAAADGDLFEIAPKQKYTQADLDWTNKRSRSSVEMNDATSRPDIAALPTDMKQYSEVYIGFPIWWYIAPRIIQTFIESVDLTGKKVIPFATSGGSGIGSVERNLHETYPDIDWQKGRLLNNATNGDINACLSRS